MLNQYALIYYAREHDQLIIEMDSRMLLHYLSTPERYKGSYVLMQLQFPIVHGGQIQLHMYYLDMVINRQV